MSTKVERSQVEWRRSKVAELDSQPEIARILQVSIGTVNRDIHILNSKLKRTSRDTLTSGCQKSMRNVL